MSTTRFPGTIPMAAFISLWYSSEICEAKRNLMKAEKKLYSLKNELSLREYKRLRKIKYDLVRRTKKDYYQL